MNKKVQAEYQNELIRAHSWACCNIPYWNRIDWILRVCWSQSAQKSIFNLSRSVIGLYFVKLRHSQSLKHLLRFLTLQQIQQRYQIITILLITLYIQTLSDKCQRFSHSSQFKLNIMLKSDGIIHDIRYNKFIIDHMSRDLNSTFNYPLNRSISKQLYSFPKSIRFQNTRPPPCSNAFYQIKRGALDNRTTSFGYGNKIDLANKQHVPPVGNYDLNGQFILNRQKNRGYSFSKNTKNDTLVNPQKSVLIPGPGAYNHNRQRSFDKYATFSYSMGSRLDDPLSKSGNKLGPGQYQAIPSLNSTGHYFISKYGNSGCTIMGRSKRKNINDDSCSPGPGKYRDEEKINLNKTGVYFNSKYRNMQAGKFGRSNRPPLADTKPVPGPGYYGQFTQFATINKSWVRPTTTVK